MTGAPNEYFSENEPLATENENLDAFKAFSSVFLCCWKEFICSSLPYSRLDGYSPNQQSGLFHVYQPAGKKKVCIQISAAGLLGNCDADLSIYRKNK